MLNPDTPPDIGELQEIPAGDGDEPGRERILIEAWPVIEERFRPA